MGRLSDMIQEVNDIVEKKIGAMLLEGKYVIASGLGVYNDYKKALLNGEQWAIDVFNKKTTDDPRTKLIYAKTYLEFPML